MEEFDLVDSIEVKKIGIANDSLDDFTNKEESRIYKIRDKAYDIRNKINCVSKEDISKADKIIQKCCYFLSQEWPALFGSIPKNIYVHIDLDSFYASVETLHNPMFKTVPLGVGSSLMLATCNYEARKYGVRAGMPGYIAKRLCPTLVITKCDFDKYNMYSEKVMSVLAAYNSSIEIYGIDEACLVFDESKLNRAYEIYNSNPKYGKTFEEEEITFKEFNMESVLQIVERIRESVFRSTRLTVSAGISVCRGLAKYSCGINKPNGTFVMEKDFDDHIFNLDVDKINGIGKATKEMLNKAFSIHKISELRNKMNLIYLSFPDKTFTNLLRLSFGLSVFDHRKAQYNSIDKSIGNSISFKATDNYKDINDILWFLVTKVVLRLKRKSMCGNILTITYKYSNFKSYTKRKKLNKMVYREETIFNECINILKETFVAQNRTILDCLVFDLNEKIRLLGVSISGLINRNSLNLLDTYKKEKVMYSIRDCPVCSIKFIHESQAVYESHVNICIDTKIKEEKESKKKLDYYFRQHKT